MKLLRKVSEYKAEDNKMKTKAEDNSWNNVSDKRYSISDNLLT